MHNAIRTALAHHQAGQLAQAEAIYRQILEQQPDHPDALFFSGLIAEQSGNTAIAIELYRKALTTKPDYIEAYNNLGNILKDQGKFEEATTSYQSALAIKPDCAEVHYNLGNALKNQGEHEKAITSFLSALACKPDFAEAYNNLGNVFENQGKLEDATAYYRNALEIKPDYAEGYYNLANVLRTRGERKEAVTNYFNALASKPDYAEAYNNLGITLQDLGKEDEAIACFRQALLFKPDYADAHNNLGFSLQNQGKLDEAIASFHNALAIEPGYADAYINLGVSLQNQGKLNDAVANFYKALKLKPDHATAYSNLLYASGYHTLLDPLQYLDLARSWELACVPEKTRLEARSRAFQRLPSLGRRLRVGYVSGDFRQHAVSYFIEQLFTHHDKNRIELFAYTTTRLRDAVTDRLQVLAEHWTPLIDANEATARARIEMDACDVLIDLSGHSQFNRLRVFAERAAPVQAHYLGYFASTGLTEMDYWIGDDTGTPPDTDHHFSEQIWRLPQIRMCYEGKADAPQPDWKPAPDGSVWLGSFNNLGKLTAATLALWARLLHALPEARLLLKTKELSDPGNRRRIASEMERHGIAADRIELQDSSITPDWAAHMAYYNRLDIALDPVGAHSGSTTSCDALWMSVPVVTLQGDRIASRMTASMLQAMGRPEWITHSEADYIDTVVALARDVNLRQALRLTQRERMAQSPLCDAKTLAGNLENAYFEMFQRWLDAQQ